MSFKAVVEFLDEKYNVLDHNFTVSIPADYSGRPKARYVGGKFNFLVEGDERTTILDLVIDPTEMLNKVTLTISTNLGMGKSTVFELYDCYFIFCEDHYSSTGSEPYTIAFTVSCAQLVKNGSRSIENPWKKTDLDRLGSAVSLEGRIIELFLTDTEGNRIDNYDIGDTVIVNLDTENYVGEDVSISLNDPKHDFEYQGKVLENDTLEKLTVKADQMQIELKVVEPQDKEV